MLFTYVLEDLCEDILESLPYFLLVCFRRSRDFDHADLELLQYRVGVLGIDSLWQVGFARECYTRRV